MTEEEKEKEKIRRQRYREAHKEELRAKARERYYQLKAKEHNTTEAVVKANGGAGTESKEDSEEGEWSAEL